VNPAAELAGSLCPECALCCNGVLFADVELQAHDDAARLAALGLKLRRTRTKVKFLQPCSCLHGDRCRIYADRPARCADFECGVFMRAAAGEITMSAARRKVKAARRLAERVRVLLRRLGDDAESVALTKRYARVMAQPVDLAGDPDLCDARGELMLAVNELMQVLHRDFLTG
jgi:hypothetical protein